MTNDFMNRRVSKQPLEYPSAGSVFKRYPGRFTAQMIDEAGLKGYKIGGAQVSEKHAGFIINIGDATAKDVKDLISHIQKTILEKFGCAIEREVIYVE
jgi:UDP-N-acetylmuramate dehydrogenase